MALRGNYPVVVAFERPRRADQLRRGVAIAQDAALWLSLAGGVCLSWPEVPRSIALATKIVLFYLFSPR